ncbi:MAG: DUF4349 domain-containing protein [Firmicutes bacterium]|nr:DUF4349 domain-containing protein [Bacillota bacterium]
MKKHWALVAMLFLVLFVVGCAAGKTARSDMAEPPGGAVAPEPQGGYDGGVGDDYVQDTVEERKSIADGSYAAAEQKLIRTAHIDMDVENIDAALAAIADTAKAEGGYLAKSSVFGADEMRRATLSVRLPAEKLEQFLAEIKKLGKVKSSSVGEDDVTLRYVDLEARIRNLARQEERLLAILERAETVEDILRIEKELGRVRGELEALTAEFRYLQDRVDYATVQLSLTETPAASRTVTGSGLKGVWQRGLNGLVRSINGLISGLGSLIVFLLSALPYLVIIALVAIPLYRRLRKSKNSHTD